MSSDNPQRHSNDEPYYPPSNSAGELSQQQVDVAAGILIGNLSDELSPLDLERNNLFEKLYRYARLPIERTRNGVLESATQLARCVLGSITDVMGDDRRTFDEKVQILTTLLAEEDARRVDYLNRTLGVNHLHVGFSSRTDLADRITCLIKEAELEETSASIQVLRLFAELTEADLSAAIELVEESTRGKLLGFLPQLGHSALRAAEIGVGVAVGSWLSRRTKSST